MLGLRGDTSGTFKVASSPFFTGVNERPPQQLTQVGVCGHEICGSPGQRMKLGACPSKKSMILEMVKKRYDFSELPSLEDNERGNLMRYFDEDINIFLGLCSS